MAKRLTEEQIKEQLGKVDGWIREGDAIRKQYTLGGFPDAIAFVARLAFDAEAADHQLQARHARVQHAQRRRTDAEGLRRRA